MPQSWRWRFTCRLQQGFHCLGRLPPGSLLCAREVGAQLLAHRASAGQQRHPVSDSVEVQASPAWVQVQEFRLEEVGVGGRTCRTGPG